MYDRLFVEICGLYNKFHFFTIILFFALLASSLYLSRRMDRRKADCLLLWLGLATTILEIIKIARRIYRGQGVESWIPLFYCSLFIFAVWLARLPWKSAQRAGYSFMTMGGILASVFFTFYPSTSLAIHPLISFASIHSFVYHFLMSYCGILILWKRLYIPARHDALYYFLFVGLACILGAICNAWLGSNCMFLRHPYKLPILQPIQEFSQPLYMLLVGFAQALLMFYVNYGLYGFVNKFVSKKTAVC